MGTAAAKLQHFLLTSFNARRGWQRDAHGTPVLTEEWMEHRWSLFETFCLPSVRGQSTRDFRWLVRFDASTGTHHRERFRRLVADMPHVVPLWRGEPFGVGIHRWLERTTERLVTTRLDNDDALHRETLARVQAAATGVTPEFLNFPEGYQLVRADGRLERVVDFSNPFLSLVERLPTAPTVRVAWRLLPASVVWFLGRVQASPRLARALGPVHRAAAGLLRRVAGAPILTVGCVDHGGAGRVAPVRQLSGERAWLQVVHERNRYLTAGAPRGDGPGELDASFGLRLPVAVRAEP